MQTSTFPAAPQGRIQARHPDMDIAMDLFVSDEAEVCVFHDKPFLKTLSWLEYDIKNSMLDFVMEDGDIRNFGIPVGRELKAYFMNTCIVNMIQIDPDNNNDVIAGAELPLIVHA